MQTPTASVAAPPDVARVLDPDLLDEARRQLDICNACRYCEGICAVFPALERRKLFTEGDVLFLANLCHDCRECFDACPYATPHEFAIDLPPLLTEVRQQSYLGYSRPRRLGAALTRGSRPRGLLALGVTILAFLIGVVTVGWGALTSAPDDEGAFYDLVPFAVMTTVAFVLSGIALAGMTAGVVQFWRDTAGHRTDLRALAMGLTGGFTLRNMDGGGPGCPYPEEIPRRSRKLAHSLVYYGFLATFLATILAAVWQELLGETPPYAATSPPVVVGIAGGIATLAGAAMLVSLKRRSRHELSTDASRAMDRDFVMLLVLVNLTGFAVLLMRSTEALGPLLLIHLGLVAAFFVTLPFGKFVHAIYRTSALVQDAAERGTPAS